MKFPRPRWPDIMPPPPDTPPAPLRVRLLWMASLWLGSTLALLAVAVVLRWVLRQ